MISFENERICQPRGRRFAIQITWWTERRVLSFEIILPTRLLAINVRR